eukprot:2805959-Rhodomonas_salina.1
MKQFSASSNNRFIDADVPPPSTAPHTLPPARVPPTRCACVWVREPRESRREWGFAGEEKVRAGSRVGGEREGGELRAGGGAGQGLELIGGREMFVRPRGLFSLDLPLTRSFSLAPHPLQQRGVHFERVGGAARVAAEDGGTAPQAPPHQPRALLLRVARSGPPLCSLPMLWRRSLGLAETDKTRGRSAQAEVHFGAHDFFATADKAAGDAWEVVVRADAAEAEAITHEALVVEGEQL